jgi:glucose/arabinose dehydrogenase
MSSNKHSLPLILIAGALSLWSCETKESSVTASEKSSSAIETEKMLIKADTLYSEFDSPWGMTWLSDGRMLVTERKGEILIFKDDKFTGEKVQGLPEVHAVNQAGLLDVAVHPKYAQNGWIYIAYAKNFEGNKAATTIMRFKLDGNQAVEQQDLITAGPAWEGGRHFGSRIVFDNEGYLYFSNGDKGDKPANAQDLTNAHGKVHRINDDGTIPSDNPFVNTNGAVASIWSYGNRNPQGLYFDKANNILWATEHGPRGGDELNRIEKGKNYGWPVITYGINYNGTILSDQTEAAGMEQPVHYWVPSIATCGVTVVTSDKYPAWKGNILVGALAKQHIARVVLKDGKHIAEEKLLPGIGRVRQISESPDGYLYAITEGTGLLVKIIPA